MGLHRCPEAECPDFGQPSARHCGCHQTDEAVLRERNAELVEACQAMTHPTAQSSQGVRPADFTDDYRYKVCRMGQGAACCRYLVLGAGGFACAKHTPMQSTIDARLSQMNAKSDNCAGLTKAGDL